MQRSWHGDASGHAKSRSRWAHPREEGGLDGIREQQIREEDDQEYDGSDRSLSEAVLDFLVAAQPATLGLTGERVDGGLVWILRGHGGNLARRTTRARDACSQRNAVAVADHLEPAPADFGALRAARIEGGIRVVEVREVHLHLRVVDEGLE